MATTTNPAMLNAGNHGLMLASCSVPIVGVVVTTADAPGAGGAVVAGGSVGSCSGVVVLRGIVVVGRRVVGGAAVVGGAVVAGGCVVGGWVVTVGGGAAVVGGVVGTTCALAATGTATRPSANTATTSAPHPVLGAITAACGVERAQNREGSRRGVIRWRRACG